MADPRRQQEGERRQTPRQALVELPSAPTINRDSERDPGQALPRQRHGREQGGPLRVVNSDSNDEDGGDLIGTAADGFGHRVPLRTEDETERRSASSLRVANPETGYERTVLAGPSAAAELLGHSNLPERASTTEGEGSESVRLSGATLSGTSSTLSSERTRHSLVRSGGFNRDQGGPEYLFGRLPPHVTFERPGWPISHVFGQRLYLTRPSAASAPAREALRLDRGATAADGFGDRPVDGWRDIMAAEVREFFPAPSPMQRGAERLANPQRDDRTGPQEGREEPAVDDVSALYGGHRGPGGEDVLRLAARLHDDPSDVGSAFRALHDVLPNSNDRRTLIDPGDFRIPSLEAMDHNPSSLPRPTPAAAINALPRTTAHEANEERGDSKCTICLCDYEDKDTLIKLPCNHFYHDECIPTWLQEHNTCPTCRGKIGGAEQEERSGAEEHLEDSSEDEMDWIDFVLQPNLWVDARRQEHTAQRDPAGTQRD